MKTSFGLALIAAIVFPSSLASQSVPAPGTRARISQTDGSVLVGTVESWGPEGVQLRTGPGDSVGLLPFASIESFQIGTRKRRFGRNFGVTLAVSTLSLGALSAASWSPCSETGFMACFLHPTSRGEAFTFGVVAGALVGVPLGVVIGLVAKDDQWSEAQRSDPGSPGPRLRPIIGRSVGFSASLPLGGR